MVIRDGLLLFPSVMFTSQGNIRRKRKAPRLPPKSTSDRMVMKRLRDERIRRAGAGEQNQVYARNEIDHADHWQLEEDNNQNPPDDELNHEYNRQVHDNGEDTSNLGISDDDNDGDNDGDDDDNDNDDL